MQAALQKLGDLDPQGGPPRVVVLHQRRDGHSAEPAVLGPVGLAKRTRVQEAAVRGGVWATRTANGTYGFQAVDQALVDAKHLGDA